MVPIPVLRNQKYGELPPPNSFAYCVGISTVCHLRLMASKSPKKRPNIKRPINNSKLMTPSMADDPQHSNSKILICVPVVLFLGIILVLGFSSNTSTRFKLLDRSPRIYGIEVVNEYPHDPNAFTQGILYAGNDTLFESTGLYGRSSVRQVSLPTGEVEIIQKMDGSQFGEGLTLLGDRLFQVLWLKKTGLVYDRNNLQKFRKFTHKMEDGWGLATDGNILYGSDGTSFLYLLNPESGEVIRKYNVNYNGDNVRYLNELEYINGEIWANIWQTDCIVRLSPEDGSVVGWILLPRLRGNLIAAGHTKIDVLNGIAWDEEKKRVFVTGKLWPKLYEIKVQPVKTDFDVGQIKQRCVV